MNDRLHRYLSGEPIRERFAERGLVIEIRANHMPDGGLVTTATDVTPSVEAADALERANENLERRVKERTEELTRLNDALGRAKGEAEEANISKTRFLAAASHDLLQPLNAARLYVTSLVERQGSGDDAQLVSNVDASLEAVEEILGALLDISRLDSGALRPEISTFRLDELMRQLEVEFAPMAREKGLQLNFVVSTRSLRSDRRLLRRLLQNLISNAIKYTPQGRVLIGCRLGSTKLRFDVYDTGLGIPKSKQRAIFQEFHRLDQGAKVARGLGLGLSIVERIARVLDHSVALEFETGAGLAFLGDCAAGASGAGRYQEQQAAANRMTQLADLVVLCIDNEPKILDGMATLLGGWGCHVLKAADLKAALATVGDARTPPTGVLVDYHLDSGNGIEAIAALRWRFGAELPAILITADRSPAVREEARARDIQVLPKPLKPAALRALMAQWRVTRMAAAE